MGLELKLQLLKFCSFLFNILFLGLGVSVAGCGIWILFGKENLLTIQSQAELSIVGFGLLVTGCVVIVVVVIGCVGVHRGHRVLLLTYLSLLVVLVLGQLFITLLLFINRRQIEDNLDATVDILIVNYGSNSSSSSRDSLINNIQTQTKCCGRTGPADWLKNSYLISLSLDESLSVLPCSCFSWSEGVDQSPWCTERLNVSQHLDTAETPLFGTGNSSYDQGCKQTLSDWLQKNIVTIVAMDLSLLGVQVLQFAVILSLYKAFGKKAFLKRANQLIDPDPAHIDCDDTQVINYQTDPPTQTDDYYHNYHNQ